MHAIVKNVLPSPYNGYLGSATIISDVTDGSKYKIAIQPKAETIKSWAQLAFSPRHPVQKGDTVLVIGDQRELFYIIGQIGDIPPRQPALRELIVKDGLRAVVEEGDNPSRLTILAKDNKVLCEYNADTGKMEIGNCATHLRISAPRGNLDLAAGGRIRLAGHHIELSGTSGIRMIIGNLLSRLQSSISVKPGKMEIIAREVAVCGQKTSVKSEDIVIRAKQEVRKVEQIQTIAKKIETAAKTIITKTENRYDDIEGVHQKRMGRFRALIQSTFHLKSRHAIIKAEDDVKIKAEKIHIG